MNMTRWIGEWMPLVVSGAVIVMAISASSVLIALKRIDTNSFTFVIGGALTWAGSQRVIKIGAGDST